MGIQPCQYSVIYADPAWEFALRSPKGEEKSPQSHYQCMSMDAMKAMRDEILFATGPDCVCVMWATFPMLQEAMELMKAWGFTYCTAGAWQKVTAGGKQGFGTGYVLRSSAEIFLIGKFGSPKIKNKSTRNALVTGDVPEDLRMLGISIFSTLREHSRKPDEMRGLLQELFDGPYLELFARTKVEGWDCWGNETTKFAEVA